MDKDQKMYQYAIRTFQGASDAALRKADEIAKEGIPEFHFLNHKVSNFWDCEKSPIGVCVWDISERGYHIDCSCYYCGDPVERK